MNPTFLNDLQLDAGFYPLASLLTGAVLYALYRLFVRMRCRSRQAKQTGATERQFLFHKMSLIS